MANIFFKMEKMDIADSLYRQVSKMWNDHLKLVIDEKTQISHLDAILGKMEDEEAEKDVVGKCQ